MAEIEYLHVCEDAFRDDRRRVSVIGIVPEILLPRVPATVPRVTIALQLRQVSATTLPLRLQWLGPSGTVVRVVDVVVDIEQDGSAFLVLPVVDVSFDEEGRHMLRTSSAGRVLLSTAIMVRVARSG